MIDSTFGRTLVIANPTAQSGKGEAGARFTRKYFDKHPDLASGVSIYLTSYAGEASEIARTSDRFDTVIALGGDGVIHEVVNGLMEIEKEKRPCFGIIPLGSGNDYARTLHIPINQPEKALQELAKGHSHRVELGWVNGHYFAETLSFGLDAAIALDTTKKRAENTKQSGEALFINSGLKIFSKAKQGFPCKITLDSDESFPLDLIICAVNVGATYGGGFQITPQASPCDGKLNVCYTIKNISIPHTLFLFWKVRNGKHLGSSIFKTKAIEKAHFEFEDIVPCQIDGEELIDTHFDIKVIPDALTVLVGESFPR